MERGGKTPPGQVFVMEKTAFYKKLDISNSFPSLI